MKQNERLVDDDVPEWAEESGVPEWATNTVDADAEWVPQANDVIAREKNEMKRRLAQEMLGYDPDVEDKNASSALMQMLNVKREEPRDGTINVEILSNLCCRQESWLIC